MIRKIEHHIKRINEHLDSKIKVDIKELDRLDDDLTEIKNKLSLRKGMKDVLEYGKSTFGQDAILYAEFLKIFKESECVCNRTDVASYHKYTHRIIKVNVEQKESMSLDYSYTGDCNGNGTYIFYVNDRLIAHISECGDYGYVYETLRDRYGIGDKLKLEHMTLEDIIQIISLGTFR